MAIVTCLSHVSKDRVGRREQQRMRRSVEIDSTTYLLLETYGGTQSRDARRSQP
jgi:hypothetical protein